MRLREIPIFLIAPLGLAAALMAHVLLQAFADLKLEALGFALYAHAAVEPVAIVEVALALWFSGVALRNALATRAGPYYEVTLPPRLGVARLTLSAGLVSLIAIAVLFGIKFSESGSAAFGLGWLGGALVPGAIALTIAIATAVGALYLALERHIAGFDHFVALLAAALARSLATLLAPAPVPLAIAPRRLTLRTAPVARHAGLRAPPKATR